MNDTTNKYMCIPCKFTFNSFSGFEDHMLKRHNEVVKETVKGVTKLSEQNDTDKKTSLSSKPSNPKDIVGVKRAPMSTVSAAVMAEVGVAMAEGALKYGRHNYRVVGVRSSVYYDSTIRHLFSWWEGEDIDPDCSLSHITKAITSLVVLRDAMIQGKLEDDRPPKSKSFYDALNARTAQLITVAEKLGLNPKHYTEENTKDGNQ